MFLSDLVCEPGVGLFGSTVLAALGDGLCGPAQEFEPSGDAVLAEEWLEKRRLLTGLPAGLAAMSQWLWDTS